MGLEQDGYWQINFTKGQRMTRTMNDKEIELRVKLEDIILLAESVTKLAQEVYSLYTKIVNETEESFDNGRPDAR